MPDELRKQSVEELQRQKNSVAKSPIGPIPMVDPDIENELRKRRNARAILGAMIGFILGFVGVIESPGMSNAGATVVLVILTFLGLAVGFGSVDI